MAEKIGPEWVQSREKRAVDLGISTVLAPVAFPTGVVAGMAIGVVDRVNPVFMQDRMGLAGDVIPMPKIRTLPNVNESSPGHRGFDDPRASKIGSFLRKTHIDELPQGLLVLSGHMSVVGPRPMVPADYEATMDGLAPKEQAEWKHALAICKPGAAMTYNTYQHISGSPVFSFYDRAMEDIEYSRTASRKGDKNIIMKSLLLANTALVGIDINETTDHTQTIGAFVAIAEKFGIDVSDKDIAYWRSVVNVSRIFDEEVDENGVLNLAPLAELILSGESLEGVPPEIIKEFRDMYEKQTPERQAILMRGTELGGLSELLRTAKTPSELIKARILEADMFAKMLAMQTDNNGSDTQQRVRFNQWLQKFTRFGYVLDSLMDLKLDNKNGNVTMNPNLGLYWALGIKTTRFGLEATSGLPKAAVPKMATAGINKAIRNYLRYK